MEVEHISRPQTVIAVLSSRDSSKATGTGGGLDGVEYRNHGAVKVLDQIDAELITTHGSTLQFPQRIPRIYHRMAAADVDMVLTELGGDLVSANNPAFFAIEELMQSMGLMIIIANDALAAYGIAQYCQNTLGFPAERIRFMTSPFRNHDGMTRRFSKIGISRTYNPNSHADLDSLVDEVLQTLPDKSSQGGSHAADQSESRAWLAHTMAYSHIWLPTVWLHNIQGGSHAADAEKANMEKLLETAHLYD